MLECVGYKSVGAPRQALVMIVVLPVEHSQPPRENTTLVFFFKKFANLIIFLQNSDYLPQ